jgi:hypothetical protein
LWAESGQIPASIVTSNGTNGLSFATASFGTQSSSRPADGHVTVLAYALGEESFQDLNGNNVWDSTEPFQDLGDVVKDVLSDGAFTPADGDEYVSLNGTSPGGSSVCAVSSSPLFAVGANIPSAAGTCDGTWTPKVYVRRSIETILSTSGANPLWSTTAGLCGGGVAIQRQSGANPLSLQNYYPVAANRTWYLGASAPASGTLRFLAADRNPVRMNPVSAGTTIVAAVVTGAGLSSASVLSGQPVVNTSTVTAFDVAYDFGTGTSPTGTLTLTLTSLGPKLQPDGKTRGGATGTTATVILSRTAPPSPCP